MKGDQFSTLLAPLPDKWIEVNLNFSQFPNIELEWNERNWKKSVGCLLFVVARYFLNDVLNIHLLIDFDGWENKFTDFCDCRFFLLLQMWKQFISFVFNSNIISICAKKFYSQIKCLIETNKHFITKAKVLLFKSNLIWLKTFLWV